MSDSRIKTVLFVEGKRDVSAAAAKTLKDNGYDVTIHDSKSVLGLGVVNGSSEKASLWRNAFDSVTDRISIISSDYEFIDINEYGALSLGLPRERIIGRKCYELIRLKDAPPPDCPCAEMLKSGKPASGIFTRDGVDYSMQAWPIVDGDGKIRSFVHIVKNVTERTFHDNARELANRLIMTIGASSDLKMCMSTLTGSLRDWSGCEAIGIRLRDGDDYPYYETRGFPATFVAYERHLCAHEEDGSIVRGEAGNPVLECMCGNVLCGRFDPSKQFFTPKGSFWSNSTTELLASTIEADRQARTRNRCNGEGYESVALVPLRYGKQVFGLLQFNGYRKDRFTLALIEQFEHLADDLAVALSRRQAEQALVESEERNRNLLGELQHRAKNSFGMIYSMINLASMTSDSPATRAALGEMSCRVRSISELYSMLYSSDFSATVRLDDYCARVAAPLIGLSDRIELKTTMKRVSAPVKIAVPIGLILTELITNAIKYAFPGERRGRISVSLKPGANGPILDVADDGAGLPEGFDGTANAGMGLNLVRALSSQISGSFSIGPGKRGTVCRLECDAAQGVWGDLPPVAKLNLNKTRAKARNQA